MDHQKTDNTTMVAKLELRRMMLRELNEPLRVLDCCQGGGAMWNVLRKEFVLDSYWGVDMKPKKGRMKIDSARLVADAVANVIDVDTYGSPWKHWVNLLPTIKGRTLVFLTIGQMVAGIVGSLSTPAIAAMGLSSIQRILPQGFHVKIGKLSVSYCLALACRHATIINCIEASSGNRNVRYIGVMLDKKNRPPVEAGGPKHQQAEKEPANVR